MIMLCAPVRALCTSVVCCQRGARRVQSVRAPAPVRSATMSTGAQAHEEEKKMAPVPSRIAVAQMTSVGSKDTNFQICESLARVSAGSRVYF